MNKMDLKPGDILVFEWNGNPYHTGIYAPLEGRIGNVIHMGNGFFRAGAICGTLESMVNLHEQLTQTGNRWNFSGQSHQLKINVYRSKILIGEDIASQARFWMEQGVPYDQKRLAESVRDQHLPSLAAAEEKNIFTYLNYCARRETAPIKAPFFPSCAESIRATFGSFFMAPVLNLPQWLIRFGLWCMFLGTRQSNRTKGFTCAGFVLACIAAVALKDEIAPVSAQTGWVSLKHGSVSAENQTSFGRALRRTRDSLNTNTQNHAGLETLLTIEQQINFNPARLKQKLSFLANVDPHRPSISAFKEGIDHSTDHWESVGELDSMSLDTGFDKRRYREEKKQDLGFTRVNHRLFGEQFKLSFPGRRLSLFQSVLGRLTGELPSDIRMFSK